MQLVVDFAKQPRRVRNDNDAYQGYESGDNFLARERLTQEDGAQPRREDGD